MAANENIDTSKQESGLKSTDADWVGIQKKTFAKWVNSHLRKKNTVLKDVESDWVDGTMLMKLINVLFSTPIPKHNAGAKMRPALIDNVSIAIKMVEDSGVRLHFLKPNHLVDKDLKMILGMIWAIILDFQIKGISVEELSAKEGLLLWCQKKTKGYKDVKVENFTTSWVDGLALCALIHKHRPDLIDFDSLDKKNKADNLQLAFNVAEQHLNIAKLLDVEDLLSVARPDERSVMTYISEFFHAFAGQDHKETAARRVQKFVQFHQGIDELKKTYESEAQSLLQWVETTIQVLNDRSFNDSLDSGKALLEGHKNWKLHVKPKKNEERLENEALLSNINSKLQVNNRVAYVPGQGCTIGEVDAAWERLGRAESDRGKALRDHLGKLKDSLRNQYSEAANKFYQWITETKDLVIAPGEGNLESQLKIINSKVDDVSNNPAIKELAALHKLLEEYGIEDNPELSYEELTLMLENLKNTVGRKAQFVEGQLLAQTKKGVPAEQIQEFKETFIYFDKDNSNTLDKLEFKACLASLGVPFRDEAAYTEVFDRVASGSPEIGFDPFVDYMIQITEDTDTARQIKDSFRILANGQDGVAPHELQVQPLQQAEIKYLETHLQNSGGKLNYIPHIDAVFLVK